MKLTVVIPCYNEIATIRAIVDAVRAAPYPDKIIIVDDCSTDGTVEVLKRDIAPFVDEITFHPDRGKGPLFVTALTVPPAAWSSSRTPISNMIRLPRLSQPPPAACAGVRSAA